MNNCIIKKLVVKNESQWHDDIYTKKYWDQESWDQTTETRLVWIRTDLTGFYSEFACSSVFEMFYT